MVLKPVSNAYKKIKFFGVFIIFIANLLAVCFMVQAIQYKM